MIEIYLTETPLGGKVYLYNVWVDHVRYDEFVSRTGPLTWAEQDDVAREYRRGLDGYVQPSVESA